jgi:RimJ/RimL family protein N-acetyltransferase
MYSGSLVRLRAHEAGDAEALYEWFNDREVVATLGARYPVTRQVERDWVEQRGLVTYATAAFAVETLDGGVFIGNAGLFRTEPENRCAELGITLGDKAYWGRGYGTDVVRTLCRFGFEELGLHRIELLVFAHNAAARRVYAKCGFVEEAVARKAHWGHGRWYDDVHMGLLDGELT